MRFSKLAIFFIICAAVLAGGIVCMVIGVTAGGMQDLDKVAEKYDWVRGDPGERGVTTQPVEDFQAIDIKGNADVYLVGEAFYKNASRLVSDDLLDSTETDVLRKNNVIVIAGDKVPQPTIEVNNGVLYIQDNSEDGFDGINLNFEQMSWTPTVLVCCPAQMLNSITCSGQVGDIKCLGISWKNASIELNTGDIEMEGVKSGGFKAHTDTGDMELQGEFLKTTSIETETGDMSIDTALSRAEYALNLGSKTGDITIGEPGRATEEYDEVPSSVTQKGGPHSISAVSETGDVKVSFGAGQ